MGCLLVLLALLTPRVVIVILAIFTRYLHTAYDTALWPILGFFFMPFTTLAYAWAQNAAGGVHGAFWVIVMIVAVLADLSAVKEGDRRRRSRVA
jgi:hypothetical protein